MVLIIIFGSIAIILLIVCTVLWHLFIVCICFMIIIFFSMGIFCLLPSVFSCPTRSNKAAQFFPWQPLSIFKCIITLHTNEENNNKLSKSWLLLNLVRTKELPRINCFRSKKEQKNNTIQWKENKKYNAEHKTPCYQRCCVDSSIACLVCYIGKHWCRRGSKNERRHKWKWYFYN